MKQIMCPVIFLNQGSTENSLHVKYYDSRCSSFVRGVHFAKIENLSVSENYFVFEN